MMLLLGEQQAPLQANPPAVGTNPEYFDTLRAGPLSCAARPPTYPSHSFLLG